MFCVITDNILDRLARLQEVIREIKQLNIGTIPGRKAQVLIYNTDTLVDVINRCLKNFTIKLYCLARGAE